MGLWGWREIRRVPRLVVGTARVQLSVFAISRMRTTPRNQLCCKIDHTVLLNSLIWYKKFLKLQVKEKICKLKL